MLRVTGTAWSALASLLLLGFAGCSGNPVTTMARGFDTSVAEGLQALRGGTKPFHVLDSAAAAGYARDVPSCLVHEHHGAMGFHHVNASLMDAKLDVRRPEILLYERMPDGTYRLNAVEFIVPYRFWPADSAAPVLMGQKLHNESNLNFWYLHVWAWNRNPEGLFANFHPDVQCPASARKVFIPSGGAQ
jgi:hypothetical protein